MDLMTNETRILSFYDSNRKTRKQTEKALNSRQGVDKRKVMNSKFHL